MKTIELIRKEIEKSEKSRYRIALETGIDKAQLSRILHGKTIMLETAEILLHYFGYTIVKRRR
jgi:transcriptional regulator with XRE-family HTH domain